MRTLRMVPVIGMALLVGAPLALAQTAPTHAPGAQQARAMSEQDARKILEGAGYSSVTDVKADEDGYSATAMKDGKTVKIEIDFDGKVEAVK